MLQVRRRVPAGARRARSVLFATAATALAIAAHAVGGGGRPDPGTVVIVLGLIAAAANAYAGRDVSPAGVVVALVAAQLSMHLLLDIGSAYHDVTAPAAGGWSMVVAHAVATVITAALLTRADDALCVLYSLVRSILPANPPEPAVPEEPVRRPAPAPEVDVVRQVLLRVSRPRRGPPCPR
jgi:hypothetical protein